MTKKEMREIAKEKLMESIATAYYCLENEDFSDEEIEEITKYICQYGTAMVKAVNKKFYTM